MVVTALGSGSWELQCTSIARSGTTCKPCTCCIMLTEHRTRYEMASSSNLCNATAGAGGAVSAEAVPAAECNHCLSFYFLRSIHAMSYALLQEPEVLRKTHDVSAEAVPAAERAQEAVQEIMADEALPKIARTGERCLIGDCPLILR